MGNNASTSQRVGSDVRRGVVKWMIKTALFFVVLPAVALFLSSGDLGWTMAWVYVVVAVLNVAANAAVLIPTSPDLLVERAQVQEGTKDWDRLLSASMALLGPLAILVVAGLDRRGGGAARAWSVEQIAALVVMAWSIFLGLWAIASNRFFSGTVRIQQDRDHAVVTGGPYRFLRHPGYAGALLFDLAMPVMLDSLWALIPALLTAVVIVARTALEDRVLQKELPGYAEYAQQTRDRLIPGVW